MKTTLTLIFAILLSSPSFAQDLLDEIGGDEKEPVFPVTATFKSSRLINMSTTEVDGKGTLEFRIAHRFGDIAGEGGGAQHLFGLDGPVGIQLYFDYSITDNMSLGFGQANFGKLLDGNFKYRILRQNSDNSIPITLTYQGRVNLTHEEESFQGKYDQLSNRMSYVNQVMIARKFGERLSLQVNAYHLHYNLVKLKEDKNDVFALGAMGRLKLNQRFALTGEIGQSLGNYSANGVEYVPSAALGVDIETGGHVFQLFFANSSFVNEAQFLSYTHNKWSKGQFRWGFNVSRVFSL